MGLDLKEFFRRITTIPSSKRDAAKQIGRSAANEMLDSAIRSLDLSASKAAQSLGVSLASLSAVVANELIRQNLPLSERTAIMAIVESQIEAVLNSVSPAIQSLKPTLESEKEKLLDQWF